MDLQSKAAPTAETGEEPVFQGFCPLCAKQRKLAGISLPALAKLLEADFDIRVQSRECTHTWVLSQPDREKLKSSLAAR